MKSIKLLISDIKSYYVRSNGKWLPIKLFKPINRHEPIDIKEELKNLDFRLATKEEVDELYVRYPKLQEEKNIFPPLTNGHYFSPNSNLQFAAVSLLI